MTPTILCKPPNPFPWDSGCTSKPPPTFWIGGICFKYHPGRNLMASNFLKQILPTQKLWQRLMSCFFYRKTRPKIDLDANQDENSSGLYKTYQVYQWPVCSFWKGDCPPMKSDFLWGLDTSGIGTSPWFLRLWQRRASEKKTKQLAENTKSVVEGINQQSAVKSCYR